MVVIQMYMIFSYSSSGKTAVRLHQGMSGLFSGGQLGSVCFSWVSGGPGTLPSPVTDMHGSITRPYPSE